MVVVFLDRDGLRLDYFCCGSGFRSRRKDNQLARAGDVAACLDALADILTPGTSSGHRAPVVGVFSFSPIAAGDTAILGFRIFACG